jgi:hypothetical protein
MPRAKISPACMVCSKRVGSSSSFFFVFFLFSQSREETNDTIRRRLVHRSLASCLLPLVSCLLSVVCCLVSRVSCLLSLVSCLVSLASCLLPLVSCHLSRVSCLLPLVLPRVMCLVFLSGLESCSLRAEASKQRNATQHQKTFSFSFSSCLL